MTINPILKYKQTNRLKWREMAKHSGFTPQWIYTLSTWDPSKLGNVSLANSLKIKDRLGIDLEVIVRTNKFY